VAATTSPRADAPSGNPFHAHVSASLVAWGAGVAAESCKVPRTQNKNKNKNKNKENQN